MIKLLREKYELLRESKLFSELKAVASHKTDLLTSKMWILPDGKPVSLDQWHYRWLQNNPKIALKYGLDVKTFIKLCSSAEHFRKAFVLIKY